MASRRQRRELSQRARLETRTRYGPEFRGLAELAAESVDTRDFEVNAARGTAGGIMQAVREAAPITKRVYDRSEASLKGLYSDVPTEAMGGLMQQVAARERAGAQGRVAESEADALADLQSRKVRAQEGRAFAVQNALAQHSERTEKIGRQRAALRADAAAFRLGALKDLEADAQQLALEKARLRIARQNAARQTRATEADITGVDPLTGQPTAIARDRAEDNALAREKEKRQAANRDGKKGPSRGAISKNQDIVASIQEARADAARLKRAGQNWRNVVSLMTLPHDKKERPYGGHDDIVARAAVELARGGRISRSTMGALKARGLLPGRTPDQWRPKPLGEGGFRERHAGRRGGSQFTGLS